MRKYFFLLSLISIFCLSFVSAVKIDNTLFITSNRSTNYSVFINQTIWCDQISVLDNGRIQIFNISSNSSDTPILYNINTSVTIVDLYGTFTNLMCYASNGSLCSGLNTNISKNDFTQLNITILPNQSIYFINQFNITEGITRPNSPISIVSKTDDSNYVTIITNTSLTDDVNVDYDGITVSSCFLTHDGWLVCNDNTVTLPSWTFLGVSDTTTILDYQDYPNLVSTCTTVNEAILNTISWTVIIFLVIIFGAILSVVLLSLTGYFDVIGLSYNLSNINLSEINWKTLILTLFIVLLIITIIVAITVLFNAEICALGA